MVNLYRKGRIGEKKVVNSLKKKGFRNIRRSKGSRGPYDIYAKKKGKKYYIQVKTGSARPTSLEIRRLKRIAKEREGVAAVVYRNKGKNRWKFYGKW